MTIIGIFVAVILMIIFPLVEVTGKNDDIAQTVVQLAVADFVNDVATNGKITEGDYNKLIQKIYATGNSYDVIIEAKILDENPERRTVATKGTGTELKITESQYYSIYTEEILEQLHSEQGEYLLKKDDYIKVTTKNTSLTLGTQLKGIFYKFLGKDTYNIGAESSALVINTGVPEKKDLLITAKPDNLYWYLNIQKHTSIITVEAMKPFNVVYIMDYSGSMSRSNVEMMHRTLIAQVQTLIGYAKNNPALQFKVSIVGFGDYAGELANITVNNTYNISDLQTRLNDILSKWEDAYVSGNYIYGGLDIRGDIRSDRIYDYNIGGYVQEYAYSPGSGTYIGPGTSYNSAGFLGNEILKKMQSSSSNDNYIIFMTDGQNEDGVTSNYYNSSPQSTYHQSNLMADSYKKYFQLIKNEAKGLYIIAYNISTNAQLNWCVGGIKKGGIYSANNSNLASIFGQITINMATTIEKETMTTASNKTKLTGIDVSKPLSITITYNDKVINTSIKAADATFIENESGIYYLNSRKFEEYYKSQIVAGDEQMTVIAVEIIFYGADIQEGI